MHTIIHNVYKNNETIVIANEISLLFHINRNIRYYLIPNNSKSVVINIVTFILPEA